MEDFGFRHQEVANKISKSREYVSNSVRLLSLPQEIIDSLGSGTITEGHARPLLMLSEKPEEQLTLHKEIIYKKLTVREAERIARHTAYERTRKRSTELNPELLELEEILTKSLGTRVQVESRGEGGKITIDYFSPNELEALLSRLSSASETLETDATDESAPIFSLEGTEAQNKNKKDDEEYLYSVKNFTI